MTSKRINTNDMNIDERSSLSLLVLLELLVEKAKPSAPFPQGASVSPYGKWAYPPLT